VTILKDSSMTRSMPPRQNPHDYCRFYPHPPAVSKGLIQLFGLIRYVARCRCINGQQRNCDSSRSPFLAVYVGPKLTSPHTDTCHVAGRLHAAATPHCCGLPTKLIRPDDSIFPAPLVWDVTWLEAHPVRYVDMCRKHERVE
jgi:hypothetical protein